MTWAELFLLISNMERCDHTSMNKPVEFLNWDGGGSYYVSIVEDLKTGNAYLIPAAEEAND